MNKTIYKILLLALFATFSQCQLSSPKQMAGNCDYYYEKDLGRSKVVMFLKDNYKTYFWGIYDNLFHAMDTVYVDPKSRIDNPREYFILDSHTEGNKALLIARWGDTFVDAIWAYKTDNHWIVKDRIVLSNLKKHVTEVKLLDIEHIRVVADGKTTIYTIDYENNRCFSDDEKK